MIGRGKLIIQKKVLFFFSITGCCGGLYIAIADRLAPVVITMYSFLQFALFLAAGIIAGTFAVMSYKSNKNILIHKDKNGNIIFIKQWILILTPIAGVASLYLNNGMSVEFRIIIAVAAIIVFVLGLAGGIYDQFSPRARKYLVVGMIPLTAGMLFQVIDAPRDIRMIIWILSVLYLLSSLLLMNSIQLFSRVFSSEGINIKNFRKIRKYNYGLVGGFFLLCMTAVFVKRIFNSGKLFLESAVRGIFAIFTRLTEWIYSKDYVGDVPPDEVERFTDFDTMPFVFYILVVFLCIATMVILVAAGKIIIEIISSNNGSNGKRSVIHNKDEYIEESEIIKVRDGLTIRKKYKYTKESLNKISDINKKIRYLYGFILERLYRSEIKIKTSDTPKEIQHLMCKYERGEKLDEIGFNEFTDIYRKVRYGGKKVQFEQNVVELARKYEKRISDIGTEKFK